MLKSTTPLIARLARGCAAMLAIVTLSAFSTGITGGITVSTSRAQQQQQDKKDMPAKNNLFEGQVNAPDFPGNRHCSQFAVGCAGA